MLAKPVTGWKTVFPAPHTTTTAARKLSPTHTNSGLKSIKKVPAGKEKLSRPAGTFNCAAPFLHAILSAPVCLVRSQKMPASGEAMCGQDFPPLTVVLVLPYFLKLLDCRTLLLFCNTLFLSQLVRDLGWEASACPPVVPLQAGKIVCRSLTWEACHFKAFAV